MPEAPLPIGNDPPPAAGGVFVPAALIHNPQLPPAALHTWIQLCALAAGADSTRPFSLTELCAATRKRPTALYAHLTVLRSCELLATRPAGRGALFLVFTAPGVAGEGEGSLDCAREERSLRSGGLDPDPPGSRRSAIPKNQIVETPPSLNPPNQTHFSMEEEGGSAICREDSGKAKARRAKVGAPRDAADPIEIFRAQAGRRPNRAQTVEVYAVVRDPDLWRRSVAHWLMHGWNPTNVFGLLDFYSRGGPEACRACAPARSGSEPDPRRSAGPFEALLAELADAPDPEEHDGSPERRRPPAEEPC